MWLVNLHALAIVHWPSFRPKGSGPFSLPHGKLYWLPEIGAEFAGPVAKLYAVVLE
jgi:hypothetical protein